MKTKKAVIFGALWSILFVSGSCSKQYPGENQSFDTNGVTFKVEELSRPENHLDDVKQ
jgi:hypothetical protein